MLQHSSLINTKPTNVTCRVKHTNYKCVNMLLKYSSIHLSGLRCHTYAGDERAIVTTAPRAPPFTEITQTL